MRTSLGRAAAIALTSALLVSSVALAQQEPPILRNVNVVEMLGDPVPLQLHFTDSDGKPYLLDQPFHHDKPVILTLVYYRCPMLCNLVVNGLVSGLRKSGLVLGKDFEALTVSINPKETSQEAKKKKAGHLNALGRSDADPDWAFLTGTQENIDALAKAVGFAYTYDAKTEQFAHAAVVMVLSPEGKITRYLYPGENGLEFSPQDLRLAAVEGSHGKVGTTLDRLILKCYQYDAAKRKYGPYALAFVRMGAVTVFFALVALLAFLWRQELKLKQRRQRGTAV